jgi:hypothetical protein
MMVLSVCAGSTFAQEKPKSKVRTITGCLSKPKSGDEYLLTGRNGSTWELHSKDSEIALADHVGHTVRVTGVVSHSKLHNMKEDAKDTAKDAGADTSNREHGHLTITSMKMVGESCRY